ncbi:hypothetical protein [Chryseobacterium polytrichastri]|uniref:Ig-like domain-containing protein n=1 Tax=Chryseobacterium polytrichastri TaxID=1302687 RepID=A0A1M6RMK2_9FLAO|nr:hypothetical protein [Chryseobacterium polytrichastri]SHK33685.1 hypothetical protein SAMN05444267_100336 [Chryseobacterium polytrichastri]
MKKIFMSLFIMSVFSLHAQKTINIFNYSDYNVINYLVGANQTNANCYPTISGTNYPVPVPPLGAVSYNGYYNSQLQSPPINSWTVQLALNNSTIQPASSPVLMPLGSTTDWMMNKFYVEDPNGTPLNYSGSSIGTLTCNTPVINSVESTPTRPYEFNAYWFVSGGETFFIIQPK